MRAEIRDPQGIKHTLEFDSQRWHGYENIAHGWDASQRQTVIEAVLMAVTRNWGPVKVALPYGFTYAS